VCPLIL